MNIIYLTLVIASQTQAMGLLQGTCPASAQPTPAYEYVYGLPPGDLTLIQAEWAGEVIRCLFLTPKREI